MDLRTRRQKLEEMARRGTPHEQDIARKKLDAMGPDPAPRGSVRFDEWMRAHPFTTTNTTNPTDEMVFTSPNGDRIVIRGVKIKFTVNGVSDGVSVEDIPGW